jgi:hypothetical protein
MARNLNSTVCQGLKPFLIAVLNVAAKRAVQKGPFVRHSERSEESLSGLDPRKEGFLASLGMTVFLLFSAACNAATHNTYSETASLGLLQLRIV